MDINELRHLFTVMDVELKYNFNIVFHPDYGKMKFDARIDMRDFFYIKRNIARKEFKVQLNDEIRTSPLRQLSSILVRRGVIRNYFEERGFHDAWLASREPYWCGYGTPKFSLVFRYKLFPSVNVVYREHQNDATLYVEKNGMWRPTRDISDIRLMKEQTEKLSIHKLMHRERFVLQCIMLQIDRLNKICKYVERSN